MTVPSGASVTRPDENALECGCGLWVCPDCRPERHQRLAAEPSPKGPGGGPGDEAVVRPESAANVISPPKEAALTEPVQAVARHFRISRSSAGRWHDLNTKDLTKGDTNG